MNPFKKLFKILGLGKKKSKESKPRFPYRFITSRWGPAAQKNMIGGERNKETVIMEQGRPKQKFPYANGIIEESLKEEMNTPTMDETGGHKSPVYDKLSEYFPAKITNRYENMDLQ